MIIFVIGVILVLVHVFLSLRRHAKTVKWCFTIVKGCVTLQLTLAGWWQSCFELCRSCCSTASTAEDKLLERKVLHRRIDGMSNAFITMANICSVLIVLLLGRTLLGLELHATVPQQVCLLVASLASICASYVLVLTPVLIESCYAIIMMAAAVYVWSSPSDSFVFYVAGIFVVQLVLSVPLVSFRSVLFWNTAVLGASLAYVTQHDMPCATPSVTFLFLVISTLLVFIAAVGFQRWTISSARQEISISNLKIENSASSALLELSCDVVLQLDSELNIHQESPAFKALLMKTSGTTTTGAPFTRYVADDQDRQDLEEQLLAAQTASEGKVGTYRTTLSDSLRNRFRADIFFVKFEVDVSVSHYLLGIRECRELDVIETPSFPEKQFKKTTPSAHRGTPSRSERAELKRRQALPRASTSGHLHFPELVLTSKNARSNSMLDCLSSWNVNIGRTTCCTYHGYLMDAREMLRMLRDSPCDSCFPRLADDRMQCQDCGIIVAEMEDPVCGICDSANLEAIEGKAETSILEL
eukprot:TRINITY_DN23958_c0_g1_i2.p1 TRINITY_DN23958_c0_g1~~TRINITY_DN23958_c0_g1_i2.p1  ORF type:complete len:551 (+),score=60.42 TRINITY_DN23958_c0_g1_i2:74-1654(+)